MSVIEKADLWYREGSSDKVYHATLEEIGSGYVVNFSYGRRGSALKNGSKTSSPTTLSEARKIYERLVSEKTSKGYQHNSNNSKSAIPVVQAKSPTSYVQSVLLNPVEDHNTVAVLIDNNDWYAQPKLDGVRFLLEKNNNHMVGYNRKGIQIAIPMEIYESVQSSNAYYQEGCSNFLIDGELIGNKYYAFDVLEHDNKNVRELSVENRIEILESILEEIESDHIVLVKTAMSKKEKVDLFDQLKKDNKEGIVFKYRFAKYVSGRPSSGGHYLKHKFYATCSCMVAEVNAKRSVGLSVYDTNGAAIPVRIGNCTIPVNHDMPQVGDIVEIKYLYAYKNGSLYQPVYLGVRSDLDEKDANYSQIKFKSEVDD
jgi:bifunctional non-homologous end joining protein LigD